MDRTSIQNIFNDKEDYILLDVRTPKEYQDGHIIGAVNLPIFSNEERIEVGTIYKQVNPQKALIRGLEFVGPKMADFVKQAKTLAKNKKIYLYCWRGGKRSGSMGWLFKMAGLDCQVIEGGYKRYREYIREQIVSLPLDLIILSGQTGSAKTETLHKIKELGHQMIDLEGLANHKGSAFGALGQKNQPSTEQFQNALFEVIRKMDLSKPIWIESESKGIGRVFMSEEFWDKMCVAKEIEIEVPIENRVEHLVKFYGQFDVQLLIDSFDRISKRLGGLDYKLAKEALENDDLHFAARKALIYYDFAYKKGRKKRSRKIKINISTKDNLLAAKEILLAFENQVF